MTITLAMSPLSLAANSYKWVDSDGVTHYSQTPPRGKDYEKMRLKKAPRSSYQAPTAPPASDANSNPAPTTGSSGGSSAKNKADIEKELAKNKKIREQNCKGARQNLSIYSKYSRVKQEDGKVVKLDSEERQRRIKESEEAIKEFCD